MLLFCAVPRSNYVLRILHPSATFEFAIQRDAGVNRSSVSHNPVSDESWVEERMQGDTYLIGQLG